MTNVRKTITFGNTLADKLLVTIHEICEHNPENEISGTIKEIIEEASIPMQMDRDTIRRLTEPVCNPLDANFDLPIAHLTRNYINA